MRFNRGSSNFAGILQERICWFLLNPVFLVRLEGCDLIMSKTSHVLRYMEIYIKEDFGLFFLQYISVFREGGDFLKYT